MMTKSELARKAGISALTIVRIEAGRPCRLATKRKVLAALNLGIEDRDRVFGAVSAPPSELSDGASGDAPGLWKVGGGAQ